MTASTNYIELADLKTALRMPTGTSNDAELSRAISAASRQIDSYCSDQFWVSDPTEKSFKAEWLTELYTGSFATNEDVVIEFDADDDGAFDTTLVATDWQAEPVDRDPLRPFNRIELLGGHVFPGGWRSSRNDIYGGGYGYNWSGYPLSRRARVRVTAQWGWPAVPPQVVQACQILAIANYKSKDLTGGLAGSTSVATGSFGAKRDILIKPAVLEPMALTLLAGLRQIVVA